MVGKDAGKDREVTSGGLLSVVSVLSVGGLLSVVTNVYYLL